MGLPLILWRYKLLRTGHPHMYEKVPFASRFCRILQLLRQWFYKYHGAAKLTPKGKRAVSLDDKAKQAFERLKEALTSPAILAMPVDGEEVILDTDASNGAIDAVSSQVRDGVERVIRYGSRYLDCNEQNYWVTHKELLAVIKFPKLCKHYLLGRKFRLRTNPAALSWLRRTPEPIGQQAQWLEPLEEFDFVIEHKSSKWHGNADDLSRRTCLRAACYHHQNNGREPVDNKDGLKMTCRYQRQRVDPWTSWWDVVDLFVWF